MSIIQYNRPQNVSRYKNEYIVFLSDEKNPKVVFNTPFPHIAYKKAAEVGKKRGKMPIVERVAENSTNFF